MSKTKDKRPRPTTRKKPEHPKTRASRPITELGLTPEEAADIRQRLRSFAPFWDDPALDVYNDV